MSEHFIIKFAGGVIVAIIAIVLGIVILIKKGKKYSIVTILCFVLAIWMFVGDDAKFLKDLIYKETTEITAVYMSDQSFSSGGGGIFLTFENGDETIRVIGARGTKIVSKLKKGSTYRVTYYNNTKIIKDYILIE